MKMIKGKENTAIPAPHNTTEILSKFKKGL
jgi:hypothetical protein